MIGTRAVQAGDIVNVVVKAGGLQQEFRYRIEAQPDVPAKKRVLVVAAEDYTGKSPNVTAGYDTAPRYLAQHVAALEAAGYEVETFDIDNAAGQRRLAEPGPARADQVPDQPRRAVALRRRQLLLGRRLRPAGRHDHRPAPPDLGHGADRQLRDGAVGAQGHARAARVRQHRRQAARRRPQRPPDVHLDERQPVAPPARTRGRRTSCSASTTRRTTRATTTCPAPPGSARARSPTTPGRTTSASSAARAAPA